jgi:hypothetical protein
MIAEFQGNEKNCYYYYNKDSGSTAKKKPHIPVISQSLYDAADICLTTNE